MTEKRIIARTAKETGVPLATCDLVVHQFFTELKKSIMTAQTVQITDFGKFQLKRLGTRVQRVNHISGRTSIIDEHLKISFLAYSDLNRRAQRKLKRQLSKEAKELGYAGVLESLREDE